MKFPAVITIAGFAAAFISGPSAAQVIEAEMTTRQGEEFRILDAGPRDAAGAVVVVHDWFGVTEMTHDALAHLGALGYRAIAVDLYDGATAASHTEAFELMENVDEAPAYRKIAAAIDNMQARGKKVVTLGFSMGSIYALRANLLRPDHVAGTVIWYGDYIEDEKELSQLLSPVLFIAGSKDGPAADQAAAFSKLGDALGKEIEVYVYPGVGHAWAQPLFNNGNNLDVDAMRASWALTESFLRRQLGEPGEPD